MIKENCSLIGYLSKSHGISGQVVLKLNGDYADEIEPGDPVFVETDEILVPFFIEEAEVFTDRAILKLEFLANPEEAQKWIGKNVYLNKNLEDTEDILAADNAGFYAGFSFTDKTSGIEGIIKEFIDNPLNPLFLVENESSEFLIPVNSDFVVEVDMKKKLLVFQLPEGLADI